MYSESDVLFEKSKKYMPGGVNRPVRAFNAVHRNPVFIDRAEGSRIFDVDGNEYIDYVCSWGPGILGHSRREVIEAVQAGEISAARYEGYIRLLEELFERRDKRYV